MVGDGTFVADVGYGRLAKKRGEFSVGSHILRLGQLEEWPKKKRKAGGA